MAEAEDVIVDAARHATVFVRDVWRRYHPSNSPEAPAALENVAPRLDLLITAVFHHSFPLRAAQPPAPPTFLQRLAIRRNGPRQDVALPATDGHAIWLPRDLGIVDRAAAYALYRPMALQQAMRAVRGSAHRLDANTPPATAALFLLHEAAICDAQLATMLPGMTNALNALRRHALANRPALERFPDARRPLECRVRAMLEADCRNLPPQIDIDACPDDVYLHAERIAHRFPGALYKDWWSGDFRLPPKEKITLDAAREKGADDANGKLPRSARLERRPQVREAPPDEDDQGQGAWMIQTSQPHEHAEDPIGMQRPTDRDEETAAEEYAESLSELPEARLVSTPGRPKEVLLSDDAPPSRSRRAAVSQVAEADAIAYPEWDFRSRCYREAAAIVRVQACVPGPASWVRVTLERHASMLNAIRRRFEMLRASRQRLRRQLDGDEIDLEACIDAYADFRAGRPMLQALYQTCRPVRRDMAILLLIDVSGSTDGWIAASRRVIDVEREALLLVCIALEGMGEPYAVHAFSGEGPENVTLRSVKAFDEAYSEDIALRIAGLEPERYTRAGAALRHASASLMRQPARHRLLLLLSDGKPNDVDDYEGRYGVEDMRQAVTEAQCQGIATFCLTIDRHAAGYLPAVFGAHRYALLPKPELLPAVLLEWMKRLIVS